MRLVALVALGRLQGTLDRPLVVGEDAEGAQEPVSVPCAQAPGPGRRGVVGRRLGGLVSGLGTAGGVVHGVSFRTGGIVPRGGSRGGPLLRPTLSGAAASNGTQQASSRPPGPRGGSPPQGGLLYR